MRTVLSKTKQRLRQLPDAGHVDLLFTDMVMPHMSGTELAERERVLYPRTKLLFTSALTEKAMVHPGGLSHGMAMLQKPFTPSALARKLRDVLDDAPAPVDALTTPPSSQPAGPAPSRRT